MSSRIRGMNVSSSTIVPRVQRLLETHVLKERPLWLDVVEACPPLPPPLTNDCNRPTRACLIEYPRERFERYKNVAIGHRTLQRQIWSLFESRSVRKEKDGKTNSRGKCVTPPPELAMGKTSSDSVNISEETAEQEAKNLKFTSKNINESTSADKDIPQFEAAIGELAAMLKEYEK